MRRTFFILLCAFLFFICGSAASKAQQYQKSPKKYKKVNSKKGPKRIVNRNVRYKNRKPVQNMTGYRNTPLKQKTVYRRDPVAETEVIESVRPVVRTPIIEKRQVPTPAVISEKKVISTTKDLNTDPKSEVEDLLSSTKDVEYIPFKKDQSRYNSWSIGAFVGMPMVVGHELYSFGKPNWFVGYGGGVFVEKHINHVFGIQLLGQMGKTKQGRGRLLANTKYHSASLLGDLNLSNLFRRVDNRSAYRWAVHLYLGAGAIGYRSETKEDGKLMLHRDGKDYIRVPIDDLSLFMQGGVGLQYKINKNFDVNLQTMLMHLMDDETFSGIRPIWDRNHKNRLNPDNERMRFRTTKVWSLNLGLIYKIGRKPEHLKWVDPMVGLQASQKVQDFTVCKSGDKDEDGVCDDWDKELDTPKGARVDGSGVALDVDMDGVIDLYDECVTVPGPASNKGCPEEVAHYDPDKEIEEINYQLRGIKFDYDKAEIKPEYFSILDRAAVIISKFPEAKFTVEGHTDTRGSQAYNQQLSQRRAESVVQYLLRSGVNPYQLSAVGKGKLELINGCFDGVICSEAEHLQNRRVMFVPDRRLKETIRK